MTDRASNRVYVEGVSLMSDLSEQLRAISVILNDDKVQVLLGQAVSAAWPEVDPVDWLCTEDGHRWQRMNFSSAYSNYLYDIRDDETDDETHGAQWRCPGPDATVAEEWAWVVQHFHISDEELAERKDPTRC